MIRVVLLALCIPLWFVALFLVTPKVEDSPWFNCHMHGDMTCGQGSPWHGYVNLGSQR
jgi:hypothetical protein